MLDLIRMAVLFLFASVATLHAQTPQEDPNLDLDMDVRLPEKTAPAEGFTDQADVLTSPFLGGTRHSPSPTPPIPDADAVPVAPPVAFPPQGSATAVTPQRLPKGRVIRLHGSTFLPAPPSARVHLKPKKVAGVVEDGRGLRIYPKSIGDFSVSVDGATHFFQVLEDSDFEIWEFFESLFKDRLGLTASVEQGATVVRGHLYRFRDWLEIARKVQTMPGHFQFKAEVDDDLRPKIRTHFEKIIPLMNPTSVNWTWHPYPILNLPAMTEAERDPLEEALRPYGVQIQWASSQLQLEPLIQVKILVAEVDRSVQQDFGINWPQEASFQLAPKFTRQADLTASLRLAESKGDAQILASPRMVARSGGTAEFLAGGEFPIRVADLGRRNVVWKRHGIFMKIQPRTDRHRRLNVSLEAEVSMPAASYDGENIPSIKTTRVSSQFDLEKSGTIALSGLVQDLRGQSRSGPLGLGDIPILGALFRSESFNHHRSELVIFVNPEVIETRDQTPGTKTHDPAQ
jgi:pilus assembly protein CpaC